MELRDLSVKQLYMLLDEKVPLNSLYHWFYGSRIPMPWQLKLLEQRISADVNYKFLMGCDRFGAQKKDRQLVLPGLRDLKR